MNLKLVTPFPGLDRAFVARRCVPLAGCVANRRDREYSTAKTKNAQDSPRFSPTRSVSGQNRAGTSGPRARTAALFPSSGVGTASFQTVPPQAGRERQPERTNRARRTRAGFCCCVRARSGKPKKKRPTSATTMASGSGFFF